MKDKTEERLLKGCGSTSHHSIQEHCGKKTGKPYFNFPIGSVWYCSECRAKLQQHRETKKEELEKKKKQVEKLKREWWSCDTALDMENLIDEIFGSLELKKEIEE